MAYCIGGKNECPPEDVGSIRGYRDNQREVIKRMALVEPEDLTF